MTYLTREKSITPSEIVSMREMGTIPGDYESVRHPLTEQSEQNKRDIARSVRRCSFTGGFVVAICWLVWFVNT